jgi:uncharacterized membrane protein
MYPQNMPMKIVIRVLWLAFMAAIANYILVAYLVKPEIVTLSLDLESLNTRAFIGSAMVSFILIYLGHVWLPKLLGNGTEERWFFQKIVQFGFAETPAVLGLVIFFTSKNFTALAVLCLVSLVALYTFFPKNYQPAQEGSH